jgi:hypothetical protein
MNYKKARIEAIVLTMVLLVSTFLVPASSIETDQTTSSHEEWYGDVQRSSSEEPGSRWFDQRYYYEDPRPLNLVDNDDAGHKNDAGDSFSRADAIYPGELVDDTPGRGVTGKLDSSDEDWFYFSVCIGQDIDITMTPPGTSDFDLALWDDTETLKDSSSNVGNGVMESVFFTAEYTGFYYMQITYSSGDSGQYSFDVNLSDQNDANTGDDAGDTFADAVLITPDTYSGYLDMNDPYDWYKFVVDTGDGIHFNLEMEDTADLSDFDISLYNEAEELVYYEKYYYDDELLYPVPTLASPEEWRVKIEIFPGWVDAPQPTEWNYYYYGSGAYNLEFAIDGSAPAPPGPIPQPDITPIAKTFIIENDPDSNRDEYGYLASIPACNYLDGGQRFLAPIIYEGDNTETEYHGTGKDRGVVDDTTQYFRDDWNTYLTNHGKSAVEYEVPADPIEAAAEIATNNWVSSDLAVVAVDGSGYEDNIKTAISKTKKLTRKVEVETIPNDSPKIVDLGNRYSYQMNLGKKWCAINVSLYGTGGAEPSIEAILPHYIAQGVDWWPHPYDSDGPKYDIYYPITRMGIWAAGADVISGDWNFEITKYAGHRHRMWVKDSDSTIHVKIETDEPSDLLVFLVDPKGHLRAPDIPYWNGPVNPIHVWNGCSFDPGAGGYGPWRNWDPDLHTEFSAEVLHPEKGLWTAIVVPRHAEGPDLTYDITAEVTYTNPMKADAAVSAANAAVIASLEHAPLLYVTEDSVPTTTANALTSLGVSNIILVGRGDIISSSVKSALPDAQADLTTMQEIIDHIKGYPASENYITITSTKYSKGESTSRYGGSGSGYFAQAANIGAYHGSPILRIGDATQDGPIYTKVNPAGMADRIETWRLWEGDYYHGSRACGHLPIHDSPIEETPMQLLIQMLKYLILEQGELPPFGLDAKRYWNEKLHDGIYNWIADYGLDLEGQEGYCFVAPRKNIYIPAHFVMMGNNSYAGHIPGFTPAYTSALVARSLLYPAVIYANPNRDIVTSQAMNFPDGNTWTLNDGEFYTIYSTRNNKKSFGTHGRTYEGHALWRAHLERMNAGASAMYYSGHGTGGSGTSAQYEQTEFCNYPNQIWWDGWRGYKYDNWRMPRSEGHTWYNPDIGGLYDFIHFDYHDELFENLRSNAIFWMSCTTADANGPMVYLDHGAVIYYGNAGTGNRHEGGLQDQEFFKDVFIHGEPIGPAYSKQVWLHFRDFTTKDPTSMYGVSSLSGDNGVETVQCIYGDPNLIVYSPEWTSPEPIDP